jgi:hypothetical protein
MMRNPSRFSSQVRTLLAVSVGLLAGGTAYAAPHAARIAAGPRININPRTGDAVEHVGACAEGNAKYHCFARVVTKINGHKITNHAAIMGTTAATIQKAYGLTSPTTDGAGKTVAIIDAYGYSKLEADLGVYRTAMNLPACTTANGCLKIVNATGGATLPANPPASDDWTVETALDVDMASAACPACKILVIQATQPDDELDNAQAVAKSLGATVISNSWGGAEQGGEGSTDAQYFNQGLPIFVAAGDDGYNDNGEGPDYPGTSGYTIAVGGTSLVTSGGTRGFTETVWGGTGSSPYSKTQITNTGAGGSACSLSIAKPSYQPANTACTKKATADVSALGDPSTGPAIYDSQAASPETPGWIQIGGTSAASPLVAAMVAASGNTGITGKFFYDNAAKFNDVTSGTNGSCGTILCVAGTGWDGPTGVGTPNVQSIKSGGAGGAGLTLTITTPSDGATVGQGFEVDATASAGTVKADLLIDGDQVDELASAPFMFTAPSGLDEGSHTVEVTSYDASGDTTTDTVNVTISDAVTGDGTDGGGGGGGGGGNGTGTTNSDNGNDVIGGCAAGGAGGGLTGLVLALGTLVTRRRRAA